MKKEFIIGVSVLVAVLILVFGINYLKGVNMFKATNHFNVTYTNVAGLTQSAPVTLNGLKVGIVRQLKYDYDNPGHVNVELNLDDELKLTEGTKAMIVTDMLGTSSVALDVPVGSSYLKPGSYLTGVTQSGLMENISTDIMPAIVAMLPKIDSILVSLNNIVADPALASSVERLDKIMENMQTSSVHLTRFMSTLPAMASDTRSMLGNLNTVSNDMTQLTGTLKGLPLEATMQNIEQASASLNELMKQLNNPNSTLGALTNDRSLYNNLNKSAMSLDSLLKDVKANPKRYISIKVF